MVTEKKLRYYVDLRNMKMVKAIRKLEARYLMGVSSNEAKSYLHCLNSAQTMSYEEGISIEDIMR